MSKPKEPATPDPRQMSLFSPDLIAPDPALAKHVEEQVLKAAKDRRRRAKEAVKKEDAFIAEKIRKFNERTGL
jgi:hypothetical protein